MTKLFYDHLVILEEIDIEIKNISQSPEEREEFWKLIDEIINHKVMISILDYLPLEHHETFLSGFHESPYSDNHMKFLQENIENDVEEIIKSEIESLKKELLQEIKSLKKEK